MVLKMYVDLNTTNFSRCILHRSLISFFAFKNSLLIVYIFNNIVSNFVSKILSGMTKEDLNVKNNVQLYAKNVDVSFVSIDISN